VSLLKFMLAAGNRVHASIAIPVHAPLWQRTTTFRLRL